MKTMIYVQQRKYLITSIMFIVLADFYIFFFALNDSMKSVQLKRFVLHGNSKKKNLANDPYNNSLDFPFFAPPKTSKFGYKYPDVAIFVPWSGVILHMDTISVLGSDSDHIAIPWTRDLEKIIWRQEPLCM